MTEVVFFRLLRDPVDDKGSALQVSIAHLNATGTSEETYLVDPSDFDTVPGSPFAYWVGEGIRQLFAELPSLETMGVSVQHGASTKRDFRFLRLRWEVNPSSVGQGLRWVPFAKGGHYSPYHADVHLLVNWENDAREIHDYLVERYPYLNGNTGWVLHPENTYFRSGLTWPRRTSRFSVRVLPAGCVFADKGPAVFATGDNPERLLALLAVLDSCPFEILIRVQLACTELARSYEIGLVNTTPIPGGLHHTQASLAALACMAHDLQRDPDRSDETTHAFCLPSLIGLNEGSFLETGLSLRGAERARLRQLASIQTEIDEMIFDLYDMSEKDRAFVHAEMGVTHPNETETKVSEDTNDLQPTPPENLPIRVRNLLMWCIGVAFGRWDVRMALDPSLIPALQGPFDPLPRCAPGALVGLDCLPASAEDIANEQWLRARQNVLDLPGLDPASATVPATEYPASIAWDGILVDDPGHSADIVTRVRQVLALLWGDQAGAIEREACEILGVKHLRDYFRDPRGGFFAFHIKRYSKSRRKAPVYWLLQSPKRNYAIWLYYPGLKSDSLFRAGREYVDAKVALEQGRLDELRHGLTGLAGSAQRQREREIERQQKLVAEVLDFSVRLDKVALMKLPPDLNDGVLISIAPLHELVPWEEAKRTWEKLMAGEYTWSTMSLQMCERGIVED